MIFEPLSHHQLKEIVNIQMKDAIARVASKGISLVLRDAALDVILSESYDPVSILHLLPVDHTMHAARSLK